MPQGCLIVKSTRSKKARCQLPATAEMRRFGAQKGKKTAKTGPEKFSREMDFPRD
jgi:hypothetical protein